MKDITPQSVIAYQDLVRERDLTGKGQMNLYTRIRRLLSFAANERGIAVDEIKKRLGYLALLKPSESTLSFDPKPIEVEEWKALLEAAKTPADRALCLLMLNAAMYIAEAIRVEWSEIKKGCLVTHRKKTGECVRAAVLWPETLDALTKMPKLGDCIFYSREGAPLGVKGAEKRFRDLRTAAKVPHVTASQLRDGALTAATRVNVNKDLCNILAGHRSGISDHYIKRDARMVAPACQAVWNEYMGAQEKPTGQTTGG